MDRRELRRRLRDKAGAAIEKAMDAVEAAPDGRWIAGSEWAVRGAFQELMRECFQEIVQAKLDSDAGLGPRGGRGVFFPRRTPRARRCGSRGCGRSACSAPPVSWC
jgi:hypothetical protein